MGAKSRSRFDEEFKRQALALVLERGSVSLVAKELGVSASALFRWKNQFEQKGQPTMQKQTGNRSILEEENQRLRKQLRQVEQEREILKKSIALFVKTGS